MVAPGYFSNVLLNLFPYGHLLFAECGFSVAFFNAAAYVSRFMRTVN